MSQHEAKISWHRNGTPFDYQSYPRDHHWTIAGVRIPASSAPQYLGSDTRVDPEQAFVASLASCHMLTFLAIAAKKKWVVDSYHDEAIGFLEKDERGALAITRVVLRPEVRFGAGTEPAAGDLQKLHQSAHKYCFVANSVKTVVDVEL